MCIRGFSTLTLVGLLAFSVFITPGCKRGAAALHLDHELANQSFEKFLESWKSGQAPESLQNAQPAIIVGDPDWKAGRQLLDYRRVGLEMDDGTNCHFSVELELARDDGEPRSQTIVYIVGTSPVITIFRR